MSLLNIQPNVSNLGTHTPADEVNSTYTVSGCGDRIAGQEEINIVNKASPCGFSKQVSVCVSIRAGI